MQALLNVSLHTSPRTSDFASLVLGSRLWPRGHSEDVALSQQKVILAIYIGVKACAICMNNFALFTAPFLPTAYCPETCPYTFYQGWNEDK